MLVFLNALDRDHFPKEINAIDACECFSCLLGFGMRIIDEGFFLCLFFFLGCFVWFVFVSWVLALVFIFGSFLGGCFGLGSNALTEHPATAILDDFVFVCACFRKCIYVFLLLTVYSPTPVCALATRCNYVICTFRTHCYQCFGDIHGNDVMLSWFVEICVWQMDVLVWNDWMW